MADERELIGDPRPGQLHFACNVCDYEIWGPGPASDLLFYVNRDHTDCNGKVRRVMAHDAVSVPQHYNSHPSGVECIEITKHMNYCLGNVIKYVWRAGLKGEAIEDLEKAATYLRYEIERLKSI